MYDHRIDAQQHVFARINVDFTNDKIIQAIVTEMKKAFATRNCILIYCSILDLLEDNGNIMTFFTGS